jgi:nucleoside-triphosphatase THEP1
MVYILSDTVQAGKTTWLIGLVERCHDQGISPDGVISPAIFDAVKNEKTGISCRLLPQDETITLALRRDLVNPEDPDFPLAMYRYWVFSQRAMEQVNRHLARITPRHLSNDLLIADELGWLEMLDGGGFSEALRVLDDRCYHNALIVVRPELVDKAIARWSTKDMTPQVFDLASIGNQDKFIERIGCIR